MVSGDHYRRPANMMTMTSGVMILEWTTSVSVPGRALMNPPGDDELSAQAETFDQRTVTLDVDFTQVGQQTTTLTDQQKQTTT